MLEKHKSPQQSRLLWKSECKSSARWKKNNVNSYAVQLFLALLARVRQWLLSRCSNRFTILCLFCSPYIINSGTDGNRERGFCCAGIFLCGVLGTCSQKKQSQMILMLTKDPAHKLINRKSWHRGKKFPAVCALPTARSHKESFQINYTKP